MTDSRSPAPRERSALDLDGEAMRRLGYDVVDRIVAHIEGMDREPAWAMIDRETAESRFREPVPETGQPLEPLLERMVREVLGSAGRIGHPRFLAFVPSAVTYPGVLADMLAAGFNPFVGTWVGGSGPTMLELVVVDWIREMLRLPEGSGGLLTSGGSEATVIALVTARDAALGGSTRDAVIYASDQTHSCLGRAAWITGFPREGCRFLPSDAEGRLDPGTLRAAIREDRDRGRRPFLVVGNAGTTSTGSVDPLAALAGVAREESLWYHIDAAYGGFAAISEAGRRALAGLETADSWVFDPHKWLYQGYECGSLLVRDPRRLRSSFRLTADYLMDVDLGEAQPNLGESGIQLSRTARALKVWLSIKHHGLAAFREAVARTLDLARRAQTLIEAESELELLTPARLGVVCFRLRGAGPGSPDALNRKVLEALNASGYAFLSSTRINGAFALRFCILSHRTTEADLRDVLDRIRELGRGIDPGV